MPDAVEQTSPRPPAVHREGSRPERERPAPTREDPPRTGPEPHKGAILDVMA